MTKRYIVLLSRYTCRFIGVSVRNLYEKVLDILSISIKYFAYINQKLISCLIHYIAIDQVDSSKEASASQGLTIQHVAQLTK